ncbi:hypothetical protein CHO01_31250 [Cellulomonas hominis]|uniref:Uncharacterized protein n=1 Tax=Cellulomonas hominis TaxID=156981 RepID=A0A511FFH8_9CELL|nr:hypothetical protein CHO01_31250 [Cellulomonas hominis]
MRVHSQAVGEALHGAQREVALTALDAPEVGPVHAERVRQGLLAQPPLGPDRPDALSDSPLQITFHPPTVRASLLLCLQTYE